MVKSNKLDLSIIIVNYNGQDFLKQCLISIFNSELSYTMEVILIDNNSLEASLEQLTEFQEQIKIIKNQENLGFAKANNQGLRIAQGKYIFLLNNDTVLAQDALEKMLNYYELNPFLGAIGPKLLNLDGSIQGFGSFWNHSKYKTLEPKKMQFLSGAAFLSTKEVLSRVGGLDENYFFYNEDLDLCFQIRKLGFELRYFPLAQVTHLGGQSSSKLPSVAFIEGYRGGLYYCHKNYGNLAFQVYRFLLFFDLVPRFLYYSLLVVFNKKYLEYLKATLKIIKITLYNEIYSK